MDRLSAVCLIIAAAPFWAHGDTSKSIGIVQGLTEVVGDELAPLDTNTALIPGVAGAGHMVRTLFNLAREPILNQNFSCIIHVVKWGPGSDSVAKSVWYVFNSRDGWTDADMATNRRLFGVKRPYLLMIHLGVAVPPGSAYRLAYSYTVKHRLPANVQDLKDAFNAFSRPPIEAAAPVPPKNYWALGTMEGDPPSDITIAAGISNLGTTINFDTVTPKFDNEGTYRWDVSIGVPILAYKQLQDVVNTAGQSTLANVDRRNVLVLGNVFFKPVDVKSDTFLAVPHLVGGVSLASKPLHAAMAGLGWGPVAANFYVGVMILTNNLPNHQLDHHYKLAFGLNVPLRTVASKLGVKSQIQ